MERSGEVHIYDPVAGGAALVVIDVGSFVEALAVFKDPATGEPRFVEDCGMAIRILATVRIFDPVAGGEALLVIDVGDGVKSLAVFTDPATGAPRLACGVQGRKGARRSGPRAARRCSCSTWAPSERAGGLHGPGDGRASGSRARRERRCLSSTRSPAATRCSC